MLSVNKRICTTVADAHLRMSAEVIGHPGTFGVLE